MTVLVLNGPNLGRLGVREPDVYGTATYADLVARCEQVAAESGLQVEVRQTDAEAEMIGWLHEAADGRIGVAAFCERADELAAAYGERFTPPTLLRDKAAANERFAQAI